MLRSPEHQPAGEAGEQEGRLVEADPRQAQRHGDERQDDDQQVAPRHLVEGEAAVHVPARPGALDQEQRAAHQEDGGHEDRELGAALRQPLHLPEAGGGEQQDKQAEEDVCGPHADSAARRAPCACLGSGGGKGDARNAALAHDLLDAGEYDQCADQHQEDVERPRQEEHEQRFPMSRGDDR